MLRAPAPTWCALASEMKVSRRASLTRRGSIVIRAGGTLECIGLAAAEAGKGKDAGGMVAYAAFGPAGGRGGQVTVSVVGFAPADSAGRLSLPSRVKDLNLDSNIVPSAVRWSQRTPCVAMPFGAASMV